MLQEVAPQRLAAGDEAVVGIGWGERRQEGERLVARSAKAAANLNSIMIWVMSLLAPAAMADDRMAQANRASAQHDFCSCLRPVGLEVVVRGRKWDKENRDHGGLCPGYELAKIRAPRGALPS